MHFIHFYTFQAIQEELFVKAQSINCWSHQKAQHVTFLQSSTLTIVQSLRIGTQMTFRISLKWKLIGPSKQTLRKDKNKRKIPKYIRIWVGFLVLHNLSIFSCHSRILILGLFHCFSLSYLQVYDLDTNTGTRYCGKYDEKSIEELTTTPLKNKVLIKFQSNQNGRSNMESNGFSLNYKVVDN